MDGRDQLANMYLFNVVRRVNGCYRTRECVFHKEESMNFIGVEVRRERCTPFRGRL
jgi:hypothetical protein